MQQLRLFFVETAWLNPRHARNLDVPSELNTTETNFFCAYLSSAIYYVCRKASSYPYSNNSLAGALKLSTKQLFWKCYPQILSKIPNLKFLFSSKQQFNSHIFEFSCYFNDKDYDYDITTI